MTIIELGALGEFVGAIAVVATLIYLAVQIRQNTRSMDASRRLALAQTYQMRADALQTMVTTAAASSIRSNCRADASLSSRSPRAFP